MKRRKVARKRLSFPEPRKAVRGNDYIGKDGLTKLENHEWLPYLTEKYYDKNLQITKTVGRDPRDILPEVLTNAGHPPRSATDCIKIYLQQLDKDYDKERDRGLQRLRELCLECAGSPLDVKHCSIISCPLWAHRLGLNPHNYFKRLAKKK